MYTPIYSTRVRNHDLLNRVFFSRSTILARSISRQYPWIFPTASLARISSSFTSRPEQRSTAHTWWNEKLWLKTSWKILSEHSLCGPRSFFNQWRIMYHLKPPSSRTMVWLCHYSPERWSHNSPERLSHYSPERWSHYSPERWSHHRPERLSHYRPERWSHYRPERWSHYSPDRLGYCLPKRFDRTASSNEQTMFARSF